MGEDLVMEDLVMEDLVMEDLVMEDMVTIMVVLDILSSLHTKPSHKPTLKHMKLHRPTHKLKHTKAHILTNNLVMWILQTMLKPQLMAISSNTKPLIPNKLLNISKLFRILHQQ